MQVRLLKTRPSLAVDENSWSHLALLGVSVKEKGRFDLNRSAPASQTVALQRFENWKLRRAFARPYFLRSTTRLSRVRKPLCFKSGRSAGSK